MSKTLSANITAGIAANSVPQFLVEIESANTLYRWATFPCNTTKVSGWSGPDFESKIADKGIGKIRRAIDISEGGNVSQVQRWSFKILNQALISDTLVSENFIGRRAEIRMIFTDQTGPSWMNALQLTPVGYIEDVTWDEDAVTFFVNDGPIKKHRTLPKETLEVSEYPDLPENNIGKAKPLLYGDWIGGTPKHRQALAFIYGASDKGNRKNYFKGISVKKSVATGSPDGKYLFAGHDLHTWDTMNVYLIGYHGGIDAWCETYFQDGTTDVSSGAFLRVGIDNSEAKQFHRLNLIPVFSSQSGTTTGANCVDENINNASTFTVGQWAKYRIHRRDIEGVLNKSGDATFGVFTVYGKAEYVGSLVNDYLTVTVQRDVDTPPGPGDDNFTSSSNSQVLAAIGNALDFSNDDFQYIEIKIEAKAMLSNDGGYWNLKELYIVCLANANGMEEVYGCGKGRKFDTWIDSPDHSNAFSSGDLIQNPAYAIESLLVDELNLKVKRYGAAVQFQDSAVSTPYFQASHSTSLALTGAVSIECMVKFISFVAAGENYIVAKIGGSFVSPFALSVSTGGKVRFWRGNGASHNYLESTATLSTGVWYHIVATAAGGSGATRYIHINGVQDNGSSIVQAVADSASVLRIGLLSGASTRTNMILDELRIWDRAITEGEAKQLYNGGNGYPKPYYPSNTKAWWRFDEEGRLLTDASTPGAGFTITDSSGNANTASSNNHTNMRWVTGASAKVPYSESEVQENDSTSNAQSSFDVIAGTRSSWLFARQYLEQKNSIDMIREACKEAHIGFFTNYLGEDTIARIDGGATGFAAPTISKFRLQGEKSSVSVKRGNLKNWYNEFVLHYKVNVVTGEPEETLFVNTPDGAAYSASYTNLASAGEDNWDLCAAAYVATLQVNRWEYTAQNIRDAATAELFLKAVIAHLTRRPYIVSGKTGFALIGYELLDLAKISHPLLPAAVSAINRFRLIEQEIDCNECEITSTFFDVGVVNEEPS